MTQIGEAVGLAFFAPAKPCPFCASKKSAPKLETLTLTNDAAKLASNLGSMPKNAMQNPTTIDDWEVWDDYWISAKRSYPCMNAHHVIPGNASLAAVPAILKWMAGTVVFEKHFYEKAKVVKQKKRAGAYATTKTVATPGSPSQKTAFKLSPSSGGASVKITRRVTVEVELVTGKLAYDVNDAANGKWLPSNNAVAGWEKVSIINAKDQDGDACNFAEAYSYNAMSATNAQFHDAHPAYSQQVRLELGALEKKVAKRAEKCKNSCPGSQFPTRGEHPVPDNLKSALDDISNRIKPKLNVSASGASPKAPWYTSTLALNW